MNKGEFNEFTKRLFVVAEVYSKELNTGVIKIYFEALKDIPLAQASLALSNSIKTLKWFPKPSELRELAIPQERLSADTAWVEVSELIRDFCGTDRKPSFSSPLIEQAVRAVGGLDYIWMAGIEQQGYIRHSFIKAYDGYVQRGHDDLMIGKSEAKQILNKVREKIGSVL